MDLYEVDYSWSCLRLSQQSSGGAGRRRKRPLDDAVGLMWPIWQHITTFSFVSAFIFVFTGGPQMPLNCSELGVNRNMFFSKTFSLDFLYTDGLVNLKCMMENHLMPTQPFPTHLVMQVWGPTIWICEMSVWCWEALWLVATWMDTCELWSNCVLLILKN